MKPFLIAFLLALMPVGAAAAESSPRSRCLEKLVRLEQSLLQQMARAGEAGSRFQRVSVPAYDGASYRDPHIVLPPLNRLLLQELRLLEGRRSECARLPDSDEGALRTVVGRGGATKRFMTSQGADE